jgi:predicted glycoside hydrolase/deacetylase ChbG (UPF0249 family)
MKKIIINADDFGWDHDATEAILTLAESGSITSTTVMINHISEQDMTRLKKTPVSIGLHINLIDGKPLSNISDVSSLVNESTGEFYKADQLWIRFIKGQIRQSHLKKELKQQLSMLSDHGIRISHADSHQHVHQYPGLGARIIKIIRDEGVWRFRNCNIPEFNDKRRFILKLFHLYSRFSKVERIKTPHVLLSSFSYYPKIDLRTFTRCVSHASFHHDTIEFMVHPGMQDKKDSYLRRKEEYDFLLSEEWKEWLKERQIQLVRYDQI